MLHRIREAWAHDAYHDEHPFSGPVEADETYIGGKRRRTCPTPSAGCSPMTLSRPRRRGQDGRSSAVKDRATRQGAGDGRRPTPTGATLQAISSRERTNPGSDGLHGRSRTGLRRASLQPRERSSTRVGEYVRGMAHTNGMESFWSMLKRAHAGTFHKLSPKHLDRYVREFAGKHNVRDKDTIDQMRHVVAGLVGKRLMYRELVADNGLSSGARSR